jgi:hypothetical protein
MNQRPRLPYWLADGAEECEGCTHGHAVETVYRCAGCDGCFCAQCVTLEGAAREPFCDGCLVAAGGG